MRKILFLSMTAAVAAFGLTGCPAQPSSNTLDNTNRTTMNGSINSNTAVVINNNSTTNSMTNSASNTMSNANKETSSAGAGTEFMRDAAQGGMAEVQMGELAASKGHSAEVKQFGQKMVTDHTKANNELKAVAVKKSFTLPLALKAEQTEGMGKLQKLSGAEFDKEYVNMMVEDHEKDVADFQKQAETGTDPEVKAFAAKTLPTLKEHLQIIKTIQAKMK